MLPEIVCVVRGLILLAPLLNTKSVVFLSCETRVPFYLYAISKSELMNAFVTEAVVGNIQKFTGLATVREKPILYTFNIVGEFSKLLKRYVINESNKV